MEWTSEVAWINTRLQIEEACGLDPAAYVDADFFGLEQKRVFERAWVCIGLAQEAAEGRLLARTVGNRSVIVTRTQNGDLAGYLNSCRHRGTELAESDCDHSGTIRCPYHRWGYALDGTLISTPLFNEVPKPNFDRADFSLLPIRVDCWGPLLFACLDPNTPPLRKWLGDLPDRMGGYRFEDWTIRDEQTVDIAANWKLISENFQEYYHLNWVHPELAKVSRVKDHYRYQGAGMYCGQTTTPVSGDDRDDWLALPPAAGLDESDAVSGRFVAIFPNVLLSVLPNHVFVMRLAPRSPDLTTETCTWLLPPLPSGTDCVHPAQALSTEAGAFEATKKFWLDVNGEDIDIVQRGQRGLTQGRVPPGPLAPRFEEPLHRFQNMLADCMTLASMETLKIPDGDGADPKYLYGTTPNPTPPAVDS